MARFNDFPHPRVLFEGVPDDIYDQMEPLAAYARRVAVDEAVELSEFDILVTFSDHPRTWDGLNLLSFDATSVGEYLRDQTTMASEITVPDGAPLASLAAESVAPFLPVHGPKTTWRTHQIAMSSGWGGGSPIEHPLQRHREMAPIVIIGESHVAAAQVTDTPNSDHPDAYDGTMLWLLLPLEAQQHDRWLAGLLELLREVAPDRFPGRPEWQQLDEWSSAATTATAVQLHELRSAWREQHTQFTRNEEELVHALDLARTVDRQGVQRLLTADGNALSDAVADAFQTIGFTVQEMDAHHQQHHGSKLEDIRVMNSEDPTWTALVEVKGYKRGASLNDLQQLMGRPVHKFVEEEHRSPDALWQVVNTHRGDDPAVRRRAIDNDRDLNHFTGAGGVLIDTRDLFRAVRDIESGAIEPGCVRSALRDAHARWTWPTQSTRITSETRPVDGETET